MLRNLDKQFRGNEHPAELYSRLVRNGAVMHMKKACGPSPEDVKIAAPVRALEAAAAIGAETAVPGPQVRRTHAEQRIASEAAAKGTVRRADRGRRGTRAAPVRHTGPAGARTVHQTPSEELVKVLGHHCPGRPRHR